MKKPPTKTITPVKPVTESYFNHYINLVFLIVICVAAIIAYKNSFIVPFQLEDYANFVKNGDNHDLSHFTKIDTWLHPSNRPLSNFTLALNYHFNGLEPYGYHLVNLIIHILTGIVLYLLIFQITRFVISKDKINRSWFAFLVSLIFVLHPIQTHAVTYLSQRTTILAALFYLLSVYFYGEGRIRHVISGFCRKTLLLYGLSLLSFILALGSKENAATLPLILLLYEICFVRSKQERLYRTYVIPFAAILFIIAAGIILTGHVPRQTDILTRGQYLLTQFQVLVRYLEIMVIPIGLNIDHDIKINTHFFSVAVIISITTLLILLETCIYLFKKRRMVSFAILWFFITLAVESSIIPIDDVMVEHRLYLPMVGFAITLVYTAWYLLQRHGRSLYKIAIILIAILYGALTIQRNHTWRSEESIWADTVLKSPLKARPHRMLADIYLKQERFEDAIAEYKIALQITPNDYQMYLSYGLALENNGDLAGAKKAYLHSLSISPEQPLGYLNLGHVAHKEREFIQAAGYFRKALHMKPDYQDALLGLAAAYDSMGEHNAAQSIYLKITKRKDASYEASVKLGMSLLVQGKYRNAIPNFEKAIQSDPAKPDAYYQLGRAYFSSHKLSKATDSWKKALAVDPTYYLAYNDLGTSAYMTQQFSLSIDYWEKSLKINSNQASIYAMVGSSYYQMGKKDKWREYYQKAADLGYFHAKKALKK